MADYGNRYEKIERLGKGATGEVYLVRDIKTGQKSALKLLRPSLLGDQTRSLEGFKQEFEILKDISHPNVAKVYDIGQDKGSGKFYISTEYVSGEGFFDATKNLSFDEIGELFVQALRAFNYLHHKKIFHYDIKPDNLLVTTIDGKRTIKVIDFGFANFFDRSAAQKRHFVIGTAQYTAPEIINCENPDGRTDLYSLACTFYYAFTRRLPFEAPGSVGPELTVKIHNMHLHAQPDKLTNINSQIPQYWDTILLKMLNKKQDDRYQSAEAVICDLNFLAHKDYEVETLDTRMSYIPDKGQLIARDKEFNIFGNYYDDRIAFEVFDNEYCYLIVVGEKGAGKSRFLEECCNIAKKDFVGILSWDEFKTLPLSEIPEPCLVVGDDVHVNEEELKQIQEKVHKKVILIVLTTDQKEVLNGQENIVHLDYFDKEQVKEYLQKTTDIEEIPDNVVDVVYSYTHGSPLFITACMKIFFEKGLLKDARGKWTKQDVEDLAVLFDNLDDDVTLFIREHLIEKLKSLNLNDVQKELLSYLALTGKPTLTDITEITNADAIEEQLQWLVENRILKIDAEHRYGFLNPLYKKVIIDQMPLAQKQEYCDIIADYYERQNRSQGEINYFRGRGKDKHHAKLLLELSEIKLQQLEYSEARENLEALLERDDVDLELMNHARIQLSQIYLDMGKYNKAQESINEFFKNNSDKNDVKNTVLAYHQLSKISKNLGKHDEAINWALKGLEFEKKNGNAKWLRVLLQNHLAKTKADLGQIEEAEKLFLDLWNIWKKELTEEERLLTARLDIELVYYHKKEYKKAIGYLNELLRFLEDHKNTIAYPVTLYKLGITHLYMEEYKEAERLLTDCLKIIKERKMMHYLFAVYNALGNLTFYSRDYQKAYHWFEHAFNLALKTAHGKHDKVIIINLANTCKKLGKMDEAKKYYFYALEQLSPDKSGSTIITRRQYLWGLNSLSEILLSEGKIEDAKKYIDELGKLVDQYEDLKSEQQYYWQLVADYGKKISHQSTVNEALEKLKTLQKNKQVSEADLGQWQEKFDDENGF